MNIWGPLLKAAISNQYSVCIIGRLAILSWVDLAVKIITTIVACKVFKAWIIQHGIRLHQSTFSGKQFVSSFFGIPCTHLGTKYSTMFTYHLSIIKRSECRVIISTVTHSFQYAANHQRDCHLFGQPLTYAWKTKFYRSTNSTLFRFVHTRHTFGPTTFSTLSLFQADAYHKSYPYDLRAQLVPQIYVLQWSCQNRLCSVQALQKQYFDAQVCSSKLSSQDSRFTLRNLHTPLNQLVTLKSWIRPSQQTDELMTKPIGQFLIVSSQLNTLPIYTKEIRIMVSIDCATLALRWQNNPNIQLTLPVEEAPLTNKSNSESDAFNLPEKCAADNIVEHQETVVANLFSKICRVGYFSLQNNF